MSAPDPPRDKIDESIRQLQAQAASRPGATADAPGPARLQWTALIGLGMVIGLGGVIALRPSAAEGVVDQIHQVGASLGSMIEARSESGASDPAVAAGERDRVDRSERPRARRSVAVQESTPPVLGSRAAAPGRVAILAGGRPAVLEARAATLERTAAASEAAASVGVAPSAIAVYSSTDRDVAPPVMRSPESPAHVLRGLPRDGDTPRASLSLELLINAEGVVEQARLHTDRPHMLDAIVLSRAKTWLFEPARRAGSPVPYLLRLDWESAPQ